MSDSTKLTLDEKRKKLKENYVTIEVLKDKLGEKNKRKTIDMTRAAYIKMIFDITKKVDKQNDEIAKVILETRLLQRDISNMTGRLSRSFAHVEHQILKVCMRVSSCFALEFTRVI